MAHLVEALKQQALLLLLLLHALCLKPGRA